MHKPKSPDPLFTRKRDNEVAGVQIYGPHKDDLMSEIREKEGGKTMTETCIKQQAHTDGWMCDCGIKSQLWGQFFRAGPRINVSFCANA